MVELAELAIERPLLGSPLPAAPSAEIPLTALGTGVVTPPVGLASDPSPAQAEVRV